MTIVSYSAKASLEITFPFVSLANDDPIPSRKQQHGKHYRVLVLVAGGRTSEKDTVTCFRFQDLH